MLLRKKTTRIELVEKIHHILKFNPNDYQIHLTWKWPVTYGCYQAVVIADDEDTCYAWVVFLREYHRVDVKKVFMSLQLHEVQEEFSRMLDLDNKSMGFISPVPHISHIDVPAHNM